MAQSKVPADWQASCGIIGFGPGGFVFVLASIADILAEREMVKDAGKTLPVIKRLITVFEKQEERAAGGGGAYYKQDGALNSGFADVLALLDRDLLKKDASNKPFLRLLRSLQSIARNWLAGKVSDLRDQYAVQNQSGANLLHAALQSGDLDARKACFLRCTVNDIFFECTRRSKRLSPSMSRN